MSVIERAEKRLQEEIRQNDLGADNGHLLAYWAAYLDGARAQKKDAAAAIEALNRLLDQNTQRCEELRKQLRGAHESYEKHLSELEAQLPKRGEWVRVENEESYHYECSRCGERPLYSRYGDVVLSGVCPMCGAKMEAQE